MVSMTFAVCTDTFYRPLIASSYLLRHLYSHYVVAMRSLSWEKNAMQHAVAMELEYRDGRWLCSARGYCTIRILEFE